MIEAGTPQIWCLARVLYDKSEHLSPSTKGLKWDDLCGGDRNYYRWCVEALFETELGTIEKLTAYYREELLTATTARYTGVDR